MIEEEVRFVQKVAAVVRSTRADYNLPNKVKTELYLRVFCETSADIIRRYSGAIETLSTCSRVVVTDSPPVGCAIVTVSDKVNQLLEVEQIISCKLLLPRGQYPVSGHTE